MIKREQVLEAVRALSESGLVKEKIKISGNFADLKENFLQAVDSITDEEAKNVPTIVETINNALIEEEENGIITELTEPEVVVAEPEELKEIVVELEAVVKKYPIKEKIVEKPKKVKKEKLSNKKTDAYGYAEETKNNLFVKSVQEKSGTMVEICARKWNKGSKVTYYKVFNELKAKGVMYKTTDNIIQMGKE